VHIQEKQVSHLTLIVSELAQRRDILDLPTEEGGILLDDDEGDLLELVTEITEDVVPNYYNGDYSAFLLAFLQVQANAAADGTGDMIADIRYWIDCIYQAGKKMVA
jgi:hypothetical protein